MKDLIWLIVSSVGLGFIGGLWAGDKMDMLDVLFPFRRHFLKRLKNTSFWDLIRMSNEIDNELEERRKKRETLKQSELKWP